MTAAEGAWLAFHVPRPEAPFRLFCLPHAGGGASLFHPWSAELAPLAEVCPVQLPGREGRIREPAVPSLGPLVARLADALAVYLDRRYAIFGHSMGALIGFELTRELRRRGLPLPAHLFVASYCAPHLQRREDRAGTVRHEAAKKLTGAQAVPAEMKGELLELLVPTLEADTRLCEEYEHVKEEALPCPISAFRGNTDYVPEEDIAGWRALTRGAFQSQTFLGDHFFLRETPRGVIQAVRRALAKSA
ncbi:thioesterase II family protein [Sorangium sp. So ce1335]|uniref:thioesterase II family protein n=1 Tax=Sorangium sp. So ce1335 TaxID=3133335 RepID=UPI003F61E1E0